MFIKVKIGAVVQHTSTVIDGNAFRVAVDVDSVMGIVIRHAVDQDMSAAPAPNLKRCRPR